MASTEERIICVKFCFKSGKTAAEAHETLCQAHGDVLLSKMTTYKKIRTFSKRKNFDRER
jgi:hypothetical protein